MFRRFVVPCLPSFPTDLALASMHLFRGQQADLDSASITLRFLFCNYFRMTSIETFSRRSYDTVLRAYAANIAAGIDVP